MMEAGPWVWHGTSQELLAGGSGRQLGGASACGGPAPAARLPLALQGMSGGAAAASRPGGLTWLGWRCLRPTTGRVQVVQREGRVPPCA